jgi:transcriptional regulator with XRE-family HTH domain
MDRPLKRWLTRYHITAAERRQVATAAGMTLNYFSQLANGHRPVSANTAARLERASFELSRVRAGVVPVLARSDLCNVCAACPHRPTRKEAAA